MGNRRRTSADRAARTFRANGSPPSLVRPVIPGVETSAWSDLPPAQYPPATVGLIRDLVELGETLARVDAYRCDTCDGLTVTRMTHPGITPATVDHDRFDPATRCPGSTTSLGYPPDLPAEWEPSHEFYRPSERELTGLIDAAIDHVLRGGLLLRLLPLTSEERPNR